MSMSMTMSDSETEAEPDDRSDDMFVCYHFMLFFMLSLPSVGVLCGSVRVWDVSHGGEKIQ